MILDKQTREAIAIAVERGIAQRMEMYEEVWLTAEQLCERFGMFTKSWLERYGNTVPRERLEVMEEKTGRVIGSRWAYPLHRINRWIAEREHQAVVV